MNLFGMSRRWTSAFLLVAYWVAPSVQGLPRFPDASTASPDCLSPRISLMDINLQNVVTSPAKDFTEVISKLEQVRALVSEGRIQKGIC